MSQPTRVAIQFVRTLSGRWKWQLVTARGGHAIVAEGGTAYLTLASARLGWRRIREWYLRSDVQIPEVRAVLASKEPQP